MPQHICSGAMMTCTFGLAPSTLSVLPVNRVNSGGPPGANIMDHKPFVNIAPFGMCTSLANPTVAAATAAALGVLTPMPCIPATSSPWIPGVPKVMLGNQPAINNTCKCICNWAGVIQFTMPGQFTVMVGSSGGGGGGGADVGGGGAGGRTGIGAKSDHAKDDGVKDAVIAGALMGAVVGATIGAALGPVGMVVGAVVGAAAGAVMGFLGAKLFGGNKDKSGGGGKPERKKFLGIF